MLAAEFLYAWTVVNNQLWTCEETHNPALDKSQLFINFLCAVFLTNCRMAGFRFGYLKTMEAVTVELMLVFIWIDYIGNLFVERWQMSLISTESE
jgi:hypothetical protein